MDTLYQVSLIPQFKATNWAIGASNECGGTDVHPIGHACRSYPTPLEESLGETIPNYSGIRLSGLLIGAKAELDSHIH